MFTRQHFEVYHSGHWFGQQPPPPSTWYLIAPALSDADEIVEWKIKELDLPLHKPGELGRGIPDVNRGVMDSILITTYTKGEIVSFLSALNEPYAWYDFKSLKIVHPKPGYEKSPIYSHHLESVRRSVNLRTRVRDFFR